MRLARTLIVPALVIGCTQHPGTPPAQGLSAFRLPAINLTVGSDPVMTASASASSNLGDPRRMAARPAVAAQVVAQYEFVTEQLREPRFVGVSPLAQAQMERGRAALRAVLGIAEAAPPAQVIAQLTALAGALQQGNVAAAERVLAAAPFTRPPGDVLATLSAMPFVPDAARAASFTDQQLNRAGPWAID
ncbi:hypothetical protein [Elioraea sp.]|uniref:hypothetical protein n=1 Tax=Elioraea sp. TaxID=2185103 RepID=UPI0025C6BA47|nr:hypothetical protein [Elioraea sp.]